jgi:uncharacterized protein (TIGR02569 family)
MKGVRGTPPPARVITAFGAFRDPEQLAGGQGTSWRLGEIVFKPIDMAEDELEWQAEVLPSLRAEDFRVSSPKRTADGLLVVDGWCAWEYVAGQHRHRRWSEIVRAGEAFHAALSSVPRPTFLDRRTDPWAVADRVAWGDLPIKDFLRVKHVPRLARALKPLRAKSQLIHGDLTGNVLFANGVAPAIIDFSPYWRPPSFASAVVIADALIWEGADNAVLSAVAHINDFAQFLVRALIYRGVTDRLFREDEPIRPDNADPYAAPVELACRLAMQSSGPSSGWLPPFVRRR